MYDTRVFCLVSLAIRDGSSCSGNSALAILPARKINGGLQIKNGHGHSMRVQVPNPNAEHHCMVRCIQRISGQRDTTALLLINETYAVRLATYILEFYGKQRTNCSAFAEYMRTGVFRECSPDRGGVVFSGSMNVFAGQKVQIGDTLAVLYYTKFARSRRLPEIRGRYRENEKYAQRDLSKLQSSSQQGMSADAFIEGYQSGIYADYHFMFCIDQYRGQPVFVQQMGLHQPGEPLGDERASIVFSIGMTNMSHPFVPATMLIKRGRKA